MEAQKNLTKVIKSKTGKTIGQYCTDVLGISYDLFLYHRKNGTLKRDIVHQILEDTGYTYQELFPKMGATSKKRATKPVKEKEEGNTVGAEKINNQGGAIKAFSDKLQGKENDEKEFDLVVNAQELTDDNKGEEKEDDSSTDEIDDLLDNLGY